MGCTVCRVGGMEKTINYPVTPSNFMLVNCTGADTRSFDNAIISALRTTGQLPSDLADIFAARMIVVGGQVRAILNFA